LLLENIGYIGLWMIVASATSRKRKRKRKRGCFLAQKFAPVLDNFVTNSMTFKKEITKN
jgi:hypothetical protein